MDNQQVSKINDFSFSVNVPLEECLERLEAYNQEPAPIFGLRKVSIDLTVVKPNTIYRIQANRSPVVNLYAEIEADGDKTIMHGSTRFNIPFFLMVTLLFPLGEALIVAILEPQFWDFSQLPILLGINALLLPPLLIMSAWSSVNIREKLEDIMTHSPKRKNG